MRLIDHIKTAGFLRAWNGADSGRMLGLNVTTTATAIAVVAAAGPAVVDLGIDGRWSSKPVPAQTLGRYPHAFGELGATQRRLRLLALARAFEDIAG